MQKVTMPTKNKKIPMRQCIGCGMMNEKRLMYRVLRTTDGSFVIDKTGRQNGRGAYLCPDSECLHKAVRSKGLERSFKMPIPKDVYEQLLQEMGESHAE